MSLIINHKYEFSKFSIIKDSTVVEVNEGGDLTLHVERLSKRIHIIIN